MRTCKLCYTCLSQKSLRKDVSMLYPVCGQIYYMVAEEKPWPK